MAARTTYLFFILVSILTTQQILAAAVDKKKEPVILRNREEFYQAAVEIVSAAHPDLDTKDILRTLRKKLETKIVAGSLPLSLPLDATIHSTLKEHDIPYFYAEGSPSRNFTARVWIPAIHDTPTIPIIEVENDQPDSRKTFLILHELGHVVHKSIVSSTKEFSLKQSHSKEFRADAFAYKQLLEKKDLDPVLTQLDSLLSSIHISAREGGFFSDYKASWGSTHPSDWSRAEAGIVLLEDFLQREDLKLPEILREYEQKEVFVRKFKKYFPEYAQKHFPEESCASSCVIS